MLYCEECGREALLGGLWLHHTHKNKTKKRAHHGASAAGTYFPHARLIVNNSKNASKLEGSKIKMRLTSLIAAFAGLIAMYWGWRLVYMAQVDENELEAFLHDRENVPDAPVYLRAGHVNKVTAKP
jgi:hypothetical protein